MTIARWRIYRKIVDSEIVVPNTSKDVLHLTIDSLVDDLEDAAGTLHAEAVACSAISALMIFTIVFVHFNIIYIALVIALTYRTVLCVNYSIEQMNYRKSATELQGDYNGPPFTPTTGLYWY